MRRAHRDILCFRLDNVVQSSSPPLNQYSNALQISAHRRKLSSIFTVKRYLAKSRITRSPLTKSRAPSLFFMRSFLGHIRTPYDDERQRDNQMNDREHHRQWSGAGEQSPHIQNWADAETDNVTENNRIT